VLPAGLVLAVALELSADMLTDALRAAGLVKAEPNPSPLTTAEQFSVWEPIPFGRDARGRRILLYLMWQSMFFGGLPRRGKTFAQRLPSAAGGVRCLCPALRRRNGRHLVVFFGLLYYGALRPAEAAALGKGDMALPGQGWGELYRAVPCAPPLTQLLHQHLTEFVTAPYGRLIRGARGGDLADSTYGRVWHRAREQALTLDELATPLARRPYDLRHAAVSTWLGVKS
jgi:integrase